MVFVFLAALTTALILTPIARRVAIRCDIVDRPDGQRKCHKEPIPLFGGVAVYAAVALPLVSLRLFVPPQGQIIHLSTVIIAAAAFVCFFGCLDDRFNLAPRTKLLLQIIATAPIVLSGYYAERITCFGTTLELGWLGMPFTIFWLVGCTNALNLLDGMDGLASVVGVLSAAMIALIAATSGHLHVSVIALALAGALAGFVVYNFPPASIYLGDSGSMVIGFIVGILAMQGSMKSSATLSIAIPAVIMTVPMFDSALAIVRRRLSGRRFDIGDRGHIHHRLLERGVGTWQALCIIGALCLATGGAAAASSVLRNDSLAWIAAISMIVLLVRARVFGHHELALAKLTMANWLSHVVHRLIDSSGWVGHVGVPYQQVDSFEDSWNHLVATATQAKVDRLQVRIDSKLYGTHIHEVWENNQTTRRGRGDWVFSMQTEGPQGWTCRMSVSAPADGLEAPAFYRLAIALQGFGRYWVQNVPTALNSESEADVLQTGEHKAAA